MPAKMVALSTVGGDEVGVVPSQWMECQGISS